jgi:hypothetical protein
MQCLRGPLNDLVAVLWIAGISYTRPPRHEEKLRVGSKGVARVGRRMTVLVRRS